MRLGPRQLVPLTVAALAGLVAGIALASCGGDDEASTTTAGATTATDRATVTATFTGAETTDRRGPTEVRVTVSGGVPEGGIVRETVDKGERIVLVVSSDVADEVHLHGYDLTRDVTAGGTARIAFQATVPGRFEVELEERGVQIAELTVEP